MSNKVTLPNLLIYGAIVTPKSGVLIENIHTVEKKWHGIVIGGEIVTHNFNGTVTRTPRWTTIELAENYEW